MAHSEVYILNYNGERHLGPCLEALSQLNLGPHSLGINVVDNGSSDKSKELVEKLPYEVSWLDNQRNLGFSNGNNNGVKLKLDLAAKDERPKPDFHIFLNNDTSVEKDWLLAAMETMANNPKAGIVGSKSLFLDRFVPLRLETPDGFSPVDFGSHDKRLLGSFLLANLEGENIQRSFTRSKLSDSYPREERGYWLRPSGRLSLAVANPKEPCRARIYLENHHPELRSIGLNVFLAGEELPRESVTITRGHPREINLSFQTDDYRRLIQNAGSFVTKSWEGGDRGFLELDQGQFDKEEEVAAICGVSMFVRAELWEKLGGFDPNFFAYYEDTDLCLRARLLGYSCVYTPHSVLKHLHCGSSGEYSEYFNVNVTWSHLLFSSKMMNKRHWRKKLSELRRSAALEFEQFKLDGSLEGKYHLRAYCRYLKKYPTFLKNRLFSWHNSPGDKLFSL